MESFSIWHWLIVLFWLVVFIYPLWRIASRAGFPGAVSLLMLIPVVNVIAIWVFAFVKWPIDKPRA